MQPGIFLPTDIELHRFNIQKKRRSSFHYNYQSTDDVTSTRHENASRHFM